MGGAVSSVVNVVSDVVGSAVDVVSDVGSFIDDNVIQPALDDPLKTAATIGAIAVGGPAVAGALGTSAATGAAIAGGAVSAGSALASGASLEDALKSGAIGATAGSVGGQAAGAVGAETGSQLAAGIAGGAAAGGTGAALTGNSIEQGLLTGAASGGITAGVNTAFDTAANLLSGSTTDSTLPPVVDLSSPATVDAAGNVISNTVPSWATELQQNQQLTSQDVGMIQDDIASLRAAGLTESQVQNIVQTQYGQLSDSVYNQIAGLQTSFNDQVSQIQQDITSLRNAGLTESQVSQIVSQQYGTLGESVQQQFGAVNQQISGLQNQLQGFIQENTPTFLEKNYAVNALSGQGTTMEDNIQMFDDGSSIQTFDDGSAIVTDYSGGTYVLDTNSGYAQAVNSATGAPIGAATSGLFDNLMSGAKSVATSALKSLLLGGKTVSGNTAGQLATGNQTAGGLLGAGVNYFLSQNQLGKLQEAYAQNVAQQQAATQQAQQAATFKPVGTTTAFGTSQFKFDPTTGQLVSAGYTPTAQVQQQVQNLFGLGASALPTTTNTADVQAQYIAQQQGLLAPGREQQLAQLRNRQFQRGTTGLATGGTRAGYAPNAAGLMATNPEMAAYYNALAQQDAQLAANAPTYAQNLLNQQIATGTGLFGAANTLEGYAQQPLTLSTNLGTLASAAGGRVGQLGLLGGQTAAQTALQGQLAGIYGQGQALSSAVNPLVTAAQQGLSTAIGNWLS
jgi:regulator of replication initiation timing